jgi:hypothetical protein
VPWPDHDGEIGIEISSIGVCWDVTIANTSDAKLSIVNAKIQGVTGSGPASVGGFQNFEQIGGSPLSFPVTLDGGEATRILVRVPGLVDKLIMAIVADFAHAQVGTTGKLWLQDVQRLLALENLDLAGNQRRPFSAGSHVGERLFIGPMKFITYALVLSTGRGSKFNGLLTYPSTFE